MAATVWRRPDLFLGLGGRPQRQQERSLRKKSLEAEELQRGPTDVRLDHSEIFQSRVVAVVVVVGGGGDCNGCGGGVDCNGGGGGGIDCNGVGWCWL